MDEKLLATLIQIPIVALCFYFIRSEISAMSKKIDEQSRLFVALVHDCNSTIRDSSAVMARLSTIIQERLPVRGDEKEETHTKRANS